MFSYLKRIFNTLYTDAPKSNLVIFDEIVKRNGSRDSIRCATDTLRIQIVVNDGSRTV